MPSNKDNGGVMIDAPPINTNTTEGGGVTMDAPPINTNSTGSDATVAPKTSMFDRAAPFQQARAAIAGQQGASTVSSVRDLDAVRQRRDTQFRSQRTGFSGNRRFHPFALR